MDRNRRDMEIYRIYFYPLDYMDRNKRDMDNIGEYIFIHRAIWIEIGEIWKDILNLFYP